MPEDAPLGKCGPDDAVRLLQAGASAPARPILGAEDRLDRGPLRIYKERVAERTTTGLRPDSRKERFIGEAIVAEDMSFSVASMAMGKPGLPRVFSWKGRRFCVTAVLEEWKECGDCRHGSGERYVRKHWYRVRTTEDLEMKIYFERQGRSSGGSRWRLYSVRSTEEPRPAT